MAANWSASARFNPSELAISSPSEDTATASRTPSVWWTKLPSSQLNWCRSADVSTLMRTSFDFARAGKEMGEGHGRPAFSALPRCTPSRNAVSRARTSSGEPLTGAGRPSGRSDVRVAALAGPLRTRGLRLRKPFAVRSASSGIGSKTGSAGDTGVGANDAGDGDGTVAVSSSTTYSTDVGRTRPSPDDAVTGADSADGSRSSAVSARSFATRSGRPGQSGRPAGRPAPALTVTAC